MADPDTTIELSSLPIGSCINNSGTENLGYQTDGSNESINDNKPKIAEDNTLQRTIGFRQGFTLMISLILGSGIFVSPGIVAADTSSVGMMLIVWATAGILAMMGSLCYCELGGILKIAGGNYMNILTVYGKVPGFLSAWVTCFVIDPCSVAAISLAIGLYFAKPFYDTDLEAESTAKIIAATVIILTLIINSIGSKVLQRAQSVIATFQVSSIVFMICLGIWQASKGNVNNFHHMFNTTSESKKKGDILHIGIAVFGALWSYDGWGPVNNIIEEMRNVGRTLPLTVMTAFPFIIACYMMANLALLTLLNRSMMSASKAVGVEFVSLALGHKFSYLMMILVGISAYGSLGGTIYACPRLTLAAAREGHMPHFLSFIYKKNSLPIPATILLSTIALLLLIPDINDLTALIMLFSQGQWFIYGSSILGVVILRIRKPNADRPFRIFIGVPIFMSIVAAILVFIPFFRFPIHSLTLLGFVLAGLPVYVVFIYFHDKLPEGFLKFMGSMHAALEKHCGMVPCRVSDM